MKPADASTVPDADSMQLDPAAGPSKPSADASSSSSDDAFLIVDKHLEYTRGGLLGTGILNGGLAVLVELADGNYRWEDLQDEAECRQTLANAGMGSQVLRCYGVFQGEEYTVIVSERPDKPVEKWADLGPDQWCALLRLLSACSR